MQGEKRKFCKRTKPLSGLRRKTGLKGPWIYFLLPTLGLHQHRARWLTGEYYSRMVGLVRVGAWTSQLPFLALNPPLCCLPAASRQLPLPVRVRPEADGCCWLMGATEREGAEWGPSCSCWASKSLQLTLRLPRQGPKGHLRPRAGAGSRSTAAPPPPSQACVGKVGHTLRCGPPGASRPLRQSCATPQGSALGLRQQIFLPTLGWPWRQMKRWRRSGPRCPEAQGAWDAEWKPAPRGAWASRAQ